MFISLGLGVYSNKSLGIKSKKKNSNLISTVVTFCLVKLLYMQSCSSVLGLAALVQVGFGLRLIVSGKKRLFYLENKNNNNEKKEVI
jgi:hypothetical protein